MPFYPGPGLGGHCIPIDPFYLAWKAREFGQSTRIIELAGEINAAMPAYVVACVEETWPRGVGPWRGRVFCCLDWRIKPTWTTTANRPPTR